MLLIAGVGEALNETGYDGKGLQVRGTFRIYPLNASSEGLGREFRPLALQMALRPIVAFSSEPLNPKQTLIDPSALSDNAQLLSLEQTSTKVLHPLYDFTIQNAAELILTIIIVTLLPQHMMRKIAPTSRTL